MPRPRSRGRKDFPQGLHVSSKGYFYAIHPASKKVMYLSTKDKGTAIKRFNALMIKWEPEIQQFMATQHARKERAVASCLPTFKFFAERFLNEELPASGIGAETQKNYGYMLKNRILPYAPFDAPVDSLKLMDFRKFLKDNWPSMKGGYCTALTVLKKVFLHAVECGDIEYSPLRDFRAPKQEGRDVYLEDEHFAAIKDQVPEWMQKVFDLLYLTCCRPSDALSLRDRGDKPNITFYKEPMEVIVDDYEFLSYGMIAFKAKKTGQHIEIEMNQDLAEVVQWLQKWKRSQGIVTQTLVVWPIGHKVPACRGQSIRAVNMSIHFKEAARAAGLPKGQYTLRDIRPKGLTDEYLYGGENNKGGHKTQRMREYYRRIKKPVRAATRVTLGKIGE